MCKNKKETKRKTHRLWTVLFSRCPRPQEWTEDSVKSAAVISWRKAILVHLPCRRSITSPMVTTISQIQDSITGAFQKSLIHIHLEQGALPSLRYNCAASVTRALSKTFCQSTPSNQRTLHPRNLAQLRNRSPKVDIIHRDRSEPWQEI